MLAAVTYNGRALDYADSLLKADKEVVLAAVKKYGSALEYADSLLKADKEVVLAAVKNYSSALKYADPLLKADKEVVLAAVEMDSKSLRFVDNRLRYHPAMKLYIRFLLRRPIKTMLRNTKSDDLSLTILNIILEEATDDISAIAKRMLDKKFLSPIGTSRKRDRDEYERDFIDK